MKNSKPEPGELFTPKNFYNLHSGSAFIWMSCVVLTDVFGEFASSTYRILALILSFVFSISLFIVKKNWRKKTIYILIIFGNTLLVYIYATGYNSISYSISNSSRVSGNQREIQRNSFFDLSNQVLWFPDYKLENKYDSVSSENIRLKTSNDEIFNQLSYLEDWIKSSIINEKTKDSLADFLKTIKTNFSLSQSNQPPLVNAGSSQSISLPFTDSGTRQFQGPIITMPSDKTIYIENNTSDSLKADSIKKINDSIK